MSYLVLDTALSFSVQTVASGKQGTATIQVTVTDTRPFLFVKHVGLSVDWGDGSTQNYEQQVSPYTTALTHYFKPGSYTIRIKAKNYQVPVAEVITKTYDVKVEGFKPQQAAGTLEDEGLQPIIYGPILPREAYPNPDDWRWHLSQDSILLESAARLLLLTDAGERLCEPDFGTRIRQMLFNRSDPTLRESLTQEIRRAFAVHLPSVEVVSVDVQGIGSTKVSLTVQLVSKLDQRPFQVATTVIKT